MRRICRQGISQTQLAAAPADLDTVNGLIVLLIEHCLPDGIHTVRLELLADPIDKAAVLAKNKNQIDKPERFAPLHFFPGALLILGELVP